MLDMLRRAGVRWLAFGIEAASERVREGVDKGFGQDLIFQTLEKVRAAGIHVIGNYIFGLPDDDRPSMQATLDLALELELRVRELLLRDGVPGLAALRRRRCEQGWPLPPQLVRLLAARGRHAAAAHATPARRPRCCASATGRSTRTSRTRRYLEMVERTFGPATARARPRDDRPQARQAERVSRAAALGRPLVPQRGGRDPGADRSADARPSTPLPIDYELIFVNDDSTDGSLALLEGAGAGRPARQARSTCRGASGWRSACSPGCATRAATRGDDGHRPPGSAGAAARAWSSKWREGADVVYTVRTDAPGEPRLQARSSRAGRIARSTPSRTRTSRWRPATSSCSRAAWSRSC